MRGLLAANPQDRMRARRAKSMPFATSQPRMEAREELKESTLQQTVQKQIFDNEAEASRIYFRICLCEPVKSPTRLPLDRYWMGEFVDTVLFWANSVYGSIHTSCEC